MVVKEWNRIITDPDPVWDQQAVTHEANRLKAELIELFTLFDTTEELTYGWERRAKVMFNDERVDWDDGEYEYEDVQFLITKVDSIALQAVAHLCLPISVYNRFEVAFMKTPNSLRSLSLGLHRLKSQKIGTNIHSPTKFTYKYTTIAEDYKGRPLEIGIPYSPHSYTPDNVSVLSHTESDLRLPFMYLQYYDAMSSPEEQLAKPRSKTKTTAMAERQSLHVRLPRSSKPYEHYFLWDPDEGKWKGVQNGVYLSRQQVELNKFNWPTRAPIIEIPKGAVDVTYNAAMHANALDIQRWVIPEGCFFNILDTSDKGERLTVEFP